MQAASPEDDRSQRWRWLIVAVLLAINFLNYVDRQVLSAVLSPIRKDLFTAEAVNVDTKMGALTTAFLLSYMVAAPIFGWLSDRMNRWWIIAGGVIFWSLASGASGLATSYLMLVVTRVLVGVGEAAYGPAAPTVLADLYPAERRGRIMSIFYAAIPVGSALGYVLGGFMADHFDWRMAFYVSMPPGILLGLVCLLIADPRRLAPARPAAKRAQVETRHYKQLIRIRSYVLNTLAMAAMVFALGALAAWMPHYISEFRNEDLPIGEKSSLGRVDWIFGVITVGAGLTGTLFGGWLADKLRSRFQGSYFLVSGIGMLIGTPLFLLALVTPFPAAWMLIFLAEFCLFLNTGPANTALANVTKPAIRASAFAINIFMIHLLGDAVSPTLVGWVTDRAGGNMNVGLAPVSVAMALSGLLWLIGTRFLAADAAAVNETDQTA